MSKRLWSTVHLLLFAIFASIIISSYWFRLSWNLSPSLPTGIYRAESINRADMKGKIVSFCPPNTPIFRSARDLGIIRSGSCPSGSAPLLKRVLAVAGDVVRVDQNVMINGKLISHSAIYKDVAHFFGSPSVSLVERKLWVMGDTEDSFDSRYFGVLDVDAMVNVLRPVLLFPIQKKRIAPLLLSNENWSSILLHPPLIALARRISSAGFTPTFSVSKSEILPFSAWSTIDSSGRWRKRKRHTIKSRDRFESQGEMTGNAIKYKALIGWKIFFILGSQDSWHSAYDCRWAYKKGNNL